MTPAPLRAATDRDCLQAWGQAPGAERLRPVVERYLAFVYSSAFRRTGSEVHAAEVTRAVFAVLARRARRLGRKTVLAGWLFQIVALASRKFAVKRRRVRRGLWFGRVAPESSPAETTLWTRASSSFDGLVDRLPMAQRNAVLLRVVLGFAAGDVARILRIREPRAGKRAARGLKKVAGGLRRPSVSTDANALAQACAVEGCAAPVPAGLACEILGLIEGNRGCRPTDKLARRTLRRLAFARWLRRLVFGVPGLMACLAVLMATAWHVDSLSGHSRLLTAFLVWSVKHEGRKAPGLTQPARPWPTNAASPRLEAAAIRRAADLYQTTNIWLAHLSFTREEWKSIEPRRIGPLPHFMQSDGAVLLRNPEAQRSGLAGVLGFDFDWARAEFEFGGRAFTNVAARLKGNGTYLSSLFGDKRSFKVDLNKFAPGQKLGGVDELNFHNLIEDRSGMSDALGYELFRSAGVPAPRTAYAWLTVSVDGSWDAKPLGLYVMVEPVNEEFAAERFGSKKTPIFKPVTPELFEFLGEDWPAYAAIYDLKTQATEAQRRRVIELARLVSQATDGEFARRVGEFLDLDEFARFLAGEVFLSSYDGILSNGQNYYLYLDPATERFGFIPWDLDHAWGGFYLLGSLAERERASIWHPWVGRNRFLERIMAVGEFRRLYRAQLEDYSTRLFVPARWNARIDEVARVIRGPVSAESDFRLAKFDQAVGDGPLDEAQQGGGQGPNRPAHQLKRFIVSRALSVRRQLDGKSKGMVLKRGHRE